MHTFYVRSRPLSKQNIKNGVVQIKCPNLILNDDPPIWKIYIKLYTPDIKVVKGYLIKEKSIPIKKKRSINSINSFLRLEKIAIADWDILEIGLSLPIDSRTFNEHESYIGFTPTLKFLDLASVAPEKVPSSRLVNYCIYCKSNLLPLTKEHIIPFGLNGDLTLVNASCEECCKITSRLELEVLKVSWIAPRTILNMKTRRPNKRQATFPLKVFDANGERTKYIPVEDYPSILIMPTFLEPTFSDEFSPLEVSEINTIQVGGLPFNELIAKYDFDDIVISNRINPVSFARMIIKIAYSFAILYLGTDQLVKSYAPQIVLGNDDNVRRIFGCIDHPPEPNKIGLHSLTIEIKNDHRVYVHVQLFSQFGGKNYLVHVGQLNGENVRFNAFKECFSVLKSRLLSYVRK